MNKARLIKELHGWNGDARLYHLNKPMKWYDWKGDKRIWKKTNYVIVSGVYAMFSGPETYIFPSDSKGRPKCMLELDGSFQGDIDHTKALLQAGYKIYD